jgi:hypothetical protein
MHKRGVTYETLRAKSKRQIIKTICDDLVKIIDAGIASSHDNGFNIYRAELPTVFNIVGVSMKDAQIIVYSELLQIYIDKGLEVRIEIADGSTYLHINWQIGMTTEERKERLNLINAHLLSKNK